MLTIIKLYTTLSRSDSAVHGNVTHRVELYMYHVQVQLSSCTKML